jgi:hypothetical protein
MGSRVGKPGAFLAVGQLVRGPHRAHAPLQRRHALLEHVVRGVLLRVGFWIVMGVDDKKLESFFAAAALACFLGRGIDRANEQSATQGVHPGRAGRQRR